MDSPDLQYGDRKNITDAQRIARIANRPSESGGGERRPTGAPAVAGKRIPPWLVQGESMFPNEPGTAGLDMGAGPGHEVLNAAQPPPDEREDILEALSSLYNGPQAAAMLHELREKRASLAAADTSGVAPGALQDPFDPNLSAQPEPELPPTEEGPPLPEGDMSMSEPEQGSSSEPQMSEIEA